LAIVAAAIVILTGDQSGDLAEHIELLKIFALCPILIALKRDDKSEASRIYEKTMLIYSLLATFILTSLLEMVF
jgi:selenocysteine-specific translation elongation factor